MLSIGCGHCGSLFFFRVQEVDGASDHNRRDQEMDGESDLGIWPEAEGGGRRERKGDTLLEQDDMGQVR
jgi:predicted  nucleic acid-binding Zn-ribbon protein